MQTPAKNTPPGAVPVDGFIAAMQRRPGWTGFAFRNPSIIFGLVILVTVIFIGLLAPVLSHADPAAISPADRSQAPSAAHWFGTDTLGRDIYSRVIYGARVSLAVGFLVAIIATSSGALIGIVSGFSRPIDAVVMRIMDGMMSIPPILLAIALMSLISGGILSVVLAVTLSEIPRVVRLVRGLVLTIREQTYIEAAIAGGTRTRTILLRHVLPNTVAPLLVQATYICAAAMVVEALLSFIGAGIPPTTPSWGNIMAEGRALFQVKPHVVLIPAVFLSLTVLAVNMLGDGLRDLLDPKLAKNL